MANIGAFATATISRQLPGISDAIINDSVLFSYLKEKGRVFTGKGGSDIVFRVRNASSAVGGSTSDWGERQAQTTQPFTSLTSPWRQYSWSLMVSSFQKQRNMNAGSEAKMFDMIAEQLSEVQQEASNRLTTHAYGLASTNATTGDNGTTIDGLEDIVDDNNTYLSTARSSNSWLQANVDTQAAATFTADSDSDGTADGLQAMQTLWRDCCKGMGKGEGSGINKSLAVKKDSPDMVITTSTGFGYYQRTLQAQYMFTGDSADPEKTLTFMGAPVKWDPFCTASRFYFLNSKHMQLDCVGPMMVDIMQEQDIPSPIAHIWVLGGQYSFYSRNPRYLGALQLT